MKGAGAGPDLQRKNLVPPHFPVVGHDFNLKSQSSGQQPSQRVRDPPRSHHRLRCAHDLGVFVRYVSLSLCCFSATLDCRMMPMVKGLTERNPLVTPSLTLVPPRPLLSQTTSLLSRPQLVSFSSHEPRDARVLGDEQITACVVATWSLRPRYLYGS